MIEVEHHETYCVATSNVRGYRSRYLAAYEDHGGDAKAAEAHAVAKARLIT